MRVHDHDLALLLGRVADAVGPGHDTGALLRAAVEALATLGVTVHRAQIAVRTLHPQLVGRAFTWREGGEIVELAFPRGELESSRFQASPLARAFQGESGHEPLHRGGPDAYPILADLRERGYTDYIFHPLALGPSTRAAATFATRAPEGFNAREATLLEALARPLALAVEIHESRRTAKSLLQAYLGANTGEAVLAGRVVRGDSERIHAALWSCDLRGFSALSASVPPEEVIETLNLYFSAVDAIVREEGGEILKFIGDAVLAIFPVGARSPAEACDRALRAAQRLLAELAEGGPALGIGLHVGDALYGNIGAPDRLDFTVIGPAVNLVTRIEGQCAPLGEPLLLSADFAATTHTSTRLVGEVPLKGLTGSFPIYAPA